MENNLPKRLQKHVVDCPHCGAQALDHMTECPKCHGVLIPKGYVPAMSESMAKKVKLIVGIIVTAIALVVIIAKLKII